MNASGKFCPICKNKNPLTATVCKYCGTLLEDDLTNIVETTKNTGGQTKVPVENVGSVFDIALIPEGGIAIYAGGALKPQYLHMDKELVIGRQAAEVASESFLDLSDLDAFNNGLSRRHAMIRRAEFGFEIIDLGSTNGSWLNSERLVPNKSYPLASGSQLRLGRMRLYVMFRPVLNGTRKN